MVVDPARTQTAELADCHLCITPVSDGHLALALIKHAVEDVRFDPSDSPSPGWEMLSDMVRDLGYGELLEHAGIDRP